MDIVFFGSDKFAVASLEALIASGQKISCAVTQPDKQKGRGLHFEGTAVKAAAQQAGLRIFQPQAINKPEAVNFLKDLSPDLFIVIAYGQILAQELLEIPRIFAINAHASLLPLYRGAAPINWAIIKGERNTGITIIKMTEKMDAGPIILQEKVEIEAQDTAITLQDKLSCKAAQLIISAINAIENKTYKLTAQDERRVSFAPKLKKKDGLIHWDNPASEISNLIRGCLGWPGAFTYYNGRLLKIYKAKVIQLPDYPLPVRQAGVVPQTGEIVAVDKDIIVVATGKDCLAIEELQIEGKRRMQAQEFITGHKISVGDKLG